MSPNAVWKPDDDTQECYCCRGIFTFAIRRHHWYVFYHLFCILPSIFELIFLTTNKTSYFCNYSRLCGNVVCNSCSRHRQVVISGQPAARICHACHTYLWIRRSGESVDTLIKIVNQCLKNYDSKWSVIYTLLDARHRILKKITKNPENRYVFMLSIVAKYNIIYNMYNC